MRCSSDDLKAILEGLKGIGESTLNHKGKVIYNYGMDCYVELSIHFEDVTEEAIQRKKLKYAELVVEERERSWQHQWR